MAENEPRVDTACDAETDDGAEALHFDVVRGRIERLFEALRKAPEARELQPGVNISPINQREQEPVPTITVGNPTSAGLRFRILRPHAEGGLGAVYVAADSELHREVALKEIQPRRADDHDSRTRFVLEAEITGGLEHPGIVPVYSLGNYSDGRPFYAMRFIRGDSLKAAIERFHTADSSGRDSARALELRQLLGRFVDVCNAVAYAHSRGVLHRDLKPDNIMLGNYGETLVVDWGLAKVIDRLAVDDEVGEPALKTTSSGSARTLAGSAMGTPQYMSPEQAAGRLDVLGPPSDVYSLGATLYHLLSGQPPLSGRDVGEVLRRVKAGEIPSVHNVAPDTPKPLAAICSKAMAVRPSDRYPSAQALRADIEKYLADEPVAAWTEPLTVRTRRWMKRHRSLVTGAAAAVAVAFAGLVVGLAVVASYNRELAGLNRELDTRNDELTRALAREQQALTAEAAQRKEAERLTLAERKAKEKAQAERDRAELITDTLVLAFRSPDPARDGRTVTVAEVLQRAANELPETLKTDPVTLASLLLAIGNSSAGLGLYGDAIPLLERARDLRVEHLGPDHDHTLVSQSNLAGAYQLAGRLDEALALSEQVLAATRERVGADHPDTLTSQNNLARCYDSLGRLAEAIELYENTLLLGEATLDWDDPLILTTRSNLAVTYQAAGRLEDALRLSADTLEAKTAVLGSDHPDTLISQSNLAAAYIRAGRLDQALPVLEQTAMIAKEELGADHPLTLTFQNNLASAYQDAGRLDKALTLCEEVTRLTEARLGPRHPDTLISKNNLADAYHAAGRLDDAIALHRRTLADLEAEFGRAHPQTLNVQNNLAAVYLQSGQVSTAIPVLEEVLAARTAELGPTHPDTLTTQGTLATAYATAGLLEKAVPLFEQTAKRRSAKLGSDHPDTLISQSSLGAAYGQTGRLEEAIALLEDSLMAAGERLDADHTAVLAIQRNLAQCYCTAGRLTEGIAVYQQTLNSREASMGADHPDTMRVRNDLAAVLESVGRLDEVIALYERAVLTIGDELPANRSNALTLRNDLAVTYCKAGLFDKAIPLHDEVLKLREAAVGAQHRQTLLSLHNLLMAMRESGRIGEAAIILAEWRPVIDDERAKCSLTPRLLMADGQVLRRMGDPRAALKALLRAYRQLTIDADDQILPVSRNESLYEVAAELAAVHQALANHRQSLAWMHEASKYGGPAVAPPRGGFAPLDFTTE